MNIVYQELHLCQHNFIPSIIHKRVLLYAKSEFCLVQLKVENLNEAIRLFCLELDDHNYY